MNYSSRSGSLGNSSTSSRSSDPRGTACKQSGNLFPVRCSSFCIHSFLLTIFSLFLCLISSLLYTQHAKLFRKALLHEYQFPIALLKSTNYCYLLITIRFGIRALINYILTTIHFFFN